MNERIEKLALDAGLLNYVDNETPTRFFVDGHADLEEVEKFAELIIQECAKIADNSRMQSAFPSVLMNEHFGVK